MVTIHSTCLNVLLLLLKISAYGSRRMYEGREKVEGRAESIRDTGNGKVSEK